MNVLNMEKEIKMQFKIALFTLISLPLIASEPSQLPLPTRTIKLPTIQAAITSYEKLILNLQTQLSKVQSLHALATTNPHAWLHQVTQEAIKDVTQLESAYRSLLLQYEENTRQYTERSRHSEKPQPKRSVRPFLGR